MAAEYWCVACYKHVERCMHYAPGNVPTPASPPPAPRCICTGRPYLITNGCPVHDVSAPVTQPAPPPCKNCERLEQLMEMHKESEYKWRDTATKLSEERDAALDRVKELAEQCNQRDDRITEIGKEAACWKAEVERLRAELNQSIEQATRLLRERTEEEAHSGRLREALEWYANPCGQCEEMFQRSCHGSSERARAALAVQAPGQCKESAPSLPKPEANEKQPTPAQAPGGKDTPADSPESGKDTPGNIPATPAQVEALERAMAGLAHIKGGSRELSIRQYAGDVLEDCQAILKGEHGG